MADDTERQAKDMTPEQYHRAKMVAMGRHVGAAPDQTESVRGLSDAEYRAARAKLVLRASR